MGADEKGFLDGETLSARIVSNRTEEGAVVSFQQTAPGHYEAHVATGGAINATIVRREAAAATKPETPGMRAGESLVGRVQLPEVETQEWPASVERPLTESRLPAGDQALSAEPSDGSRWNPPALRSVPLAALCWVLAVAAALTAMWLRR